MSKQDKTVQGAVKTVYTKAILMVVALILLVAALIFFTTAWYTKMVSTAGVNLQAAQWDFTANHTVDAIQVNVYEYESMAKGRHRAAPGTAGWIPVTLGATQSDTDVTYYLSVDKSSMSQEFKERIFFYYYKADESGNRTKVYLNEKPESATESIEPQMTGTIPAKGQIQVKVGWEWIYEAPTSVTEPGRTTWDEFDTKVGRNPDLYESDMAAAIKVMGVEFRHGDPLNQEAGY